MLMNSLLAKCSLGSALNALSEEAKDNTLNRSDIRPQNCSNYFFSCFSYPEKNSPRNLVLYVQEVLTLKKEKQIEGAMPEKGLKI